MTAKLPKLKGLCQNQSILKPHKLTKIKIFELLYFKICSIDFGHPVTFSKRNYYGTDVIFIPLVIIILVPIERGDYSCKHSLPQCQQEVSRVVWNKVTAFSLLGNWPLEGRLKVFFPFFGLREQEKRYFLLIRHCPSSCLAFFGLE